MVKKRNLFLFFLNYVSMAVAGVDAYSCLSDNIILQNLEEFDVSVQNILFMEKVRQDSFYVEIHMFGENAKYGDLVEYETSFISKKNNQYSRKRFSNFSIKDESTSPYLVEHIERTLENGLLNEERIYSSTNQAYSSKEVLVYKNSRLRYSIKCRMENNRCTELSRLLIYKYYDDSRLLTEVRNISKEVFFEGMDLVLDTSFHSTLTTIHYDIGGRYDEIQCGGNDFKFRYLNESCARIFFKDKGIGLFCKNGNGKFLKMPKDILFYSEKKSQFGSVFSSFQRLSDKSLYRLNRRIEYDDNANIKTMVVMDGYPKESFFNRFNKTAPFSIDSLSVEYDGHERPKSMTKYHIGKNVGSLKYATIFHYEFRYQE